MDPQQHKTCTHPNPPVADIIHLAPAQPAASVPTPEDTDRLLDAITERLGPVAASEVMGLGATLKERELILLLLDGDRDMIDLSAHLRATLKATQRLLFALVNRGAVVRLDEGGWSLFWSPQGQRQRVINALAQEDEATGLVWPLTVPSLAARCGLRAAQVQEALVELRATDRVCCDDTHHPSYWLVQGRCGVVVRGQRGAQTWVLELRSRTRRLRHEIRLQRTDRTWANPSGQTAWWSLEEAARHEAARRL